MALNIQTNGQTLPSGSHSIINLKTGFEKIIYHYTVTNTDVVPGASGTTYAVSVKPPLSSTWTMLETFPGSGVQVTGTLADPDTDTSGRIDIGSQAVPLTPELTYRLEITNDNVAGNTVVELFPQVTALEDSKDIVISDSFHNLISRSTNQTDWSYTGFPDLTSTGLTAVDLSSADPNFPGNDMNYAIVHYAAGVRSNGANAADVESQIIIGSIAENGTDVDTTRTFNVNLKGRVGETNDAEDQGVYYIKMTDDKRIFFGLNTIEEAGSNAFGNINVIGYTK